MTKARIAEPNYTQSPNVFYDEILCEIDTLAELKVTDTIIRQTFGYHRQAATLTYSSLERLTGLSREAVGAGLKAALARGTISRSRVGRGFEYELSVGGTDSKESAEPTDKSRENRPLGVGSADQPSLYKENSKEKGKEKPPSVGEIWEQETGQPVPGTILLEQLKYLVDEYGRDEVVAALQTAAARRNAGQLRSVNIPYVRGILRNGGATTQAPHEAARNGNNRSSQEPSHHPPHVLPPDPEQEAKILSPQELGEKARKLMDEQKAAKAAARSAS